MTNTQKNLLWAGGLAAAAYFLLVNEKTMLADEIDPDNVGLNDKEYDEGKKLYAKYETLSKLSGMSYGSEKTQEEWEKKTGINLTPYINEKYIAVSKWGKCHWTQKAENAMDLFYGKVKSNWNALGIKH